MLADEDLNALEQTVIKVIGDLQNGLRQLRNYGESFAADLVDLVNDAALAFPSGSWRDLPDDIQRRLIGLALIETIYPKPPPQ